MPKKPPAYVIVANRLPVRSTKGEGKLSGQLVWHTSPGGLVSALTPILREMGGSWIGWSGTSGRAPKPFKHDGFRNVPVPLSRTEVEDFYQGFSNSTLWPLYHDCVRTPQFHRRWWQPYVDVNRRFADAAAREAPRNACVWVQDYHLHLVPAMLRAKRPDVRIGFFLHIPFPPAELFAQLPWRKQVLEGLLGADVVGCQTKNGSRNFADVCARFTDTTVKGGRLHHGGREVAYGEFPISIDFDRFADEAATSRTQAKREALRARLGAGRKILLGIDRLDYTKGLDVRLKAFRELIESGATNIEECVLVQTAVPSRENVQAYRRERSRVEQLVGEINGTYGSIGRVAVHYLHQNLPFEELVALYTAADAMVVTPLRDGMNLVAKEYVASRTREDGVLLLSEFTGAAHELSGAVMVNPHDVDGTGASMLAALRMPVAEQRERMRRMRTRVRNHDVYKWARSFREALEA